MTSRTRRFSAGLITGYAAILVNVGYTLASVPLALHYLGKEEFGLWALAQQVAGYMLLLDFGMSGAIARFYANYKDDVNGLGYRELMSASILVYCIQGILIALAGAFISSIAPILFNVPTNLVSNFRWTLTIITVSSGVSVALRFVGGPIWAFHRMDVTNGLAIFGLISNYAVLWLGLFSGWGIYSLAIAVTPSVVVTPVVAFFVCYSCGYYPKNFNWVRPSSKLFRKLFGFGRDTMLLSLGQQMVNASQIIIVSRFLGLDVAASFAIGTKAYSLCQQFVSKITESSAPALTEIFVRDDMERFRKRFWNILQLSMGIAGIGAICIILFNNKFIELWTKGVISWSNHGNILLAVLLLVTALSRCISSIFGITGDLKPMRYVYFIEGVIFIILAFASINDYSICGVLASSIISHVVVTLFWNIKSFIPIFFNKSKSIA